MEQALGDVQDPLAGHVDVGNFATVASGQSGVLIDTLLLPGELRQLGDLVHHRDLVIDVGG